MKKGYLIYEEADAKKNIWFIDKLTKELDSHNIKLELIYAHNVNQSIQTNPDFVINRARDFKISEMFDSNMTKVVNPINICRLGNDKDLAYKFMDSINIPYMPYICTDKYDLDTVLSLANDFGYPFVLKPTDGHGGMDVSLISSKEELIATINNIANEHKYKKILLQRCCASYGKDLRVYVLNNKIVAGMLRVSGNKDDIRANFSVGGTATLHKLTEEELILTNKIIKSLPSDFIGIDFIYDRNNSPVFNEIEDAVGSRMLYQNTSLDIVKMFANHIASSIK